MKKLILLVAVLASASAAFAQVDPSRPMVTGRGNVSVRPVNVIVTNQTMEKPEEAVTLEAVQVTGSLIRSPAKVAAQPVTRR